MARPKPKLLVRNGKSVGAGPKLGTLGASASSKPKSPLTLLGSKKNHKKSQLPEQAFAMPGFGDTGLTGES